MVQLGNVDKVLYYLRKREQYCHSEIYSDVESDPSVECIMRGVEAMRAFQPDVIIAIGGGSAIDAAKGMWLFYEHPDTSFDGLRQRFLDIRKRAFKFPELGTKTKLVAIPTTSGTGSEGHELLRHHRQEERQHQISSGRLQPHAGRGHHRPASSPGRCPRASWPTPAWTF